MHLLNLALLTRKQTKLSREDFKAVREGFHKPVLFATKNLLRPDGTGTLLDTIKINGRNIPVIAPPHGDFGLFRFFGMIQSDNMKHVAAELAVNGEHGHHTVKLTLRDYLKKHTGTQGNESNISDE